MYFFIGASLSKPHIDRDNGLHTRNNGMYLCIIYPAFVTPWFPRSVYALKYSVYDMLTCMIYNCMHSTRSTEQQRRLELLVSAVKIIDEDR